MLPTKKLPKKIVQFFLKFMLLQVTILTIFQQFNRISQYVNFDFNYQILGPYMVKTSKFPVGQNCYKFYDTTGNFISVYGTVMTHEDYMKKVQQTTVDHNSLLEILVLTLSLISALSMELLSFIRDENVVILLDNLFSYILPHFFLFQNTMNWGDLCIEGSAILNVMDYLMMPYIGQITIFGLVVLILLFFLIHGCGLTHCHIISFTYGCFVSLFILYVVAIDIVNIYTSIYILRVLFCVKSILMGFQLYVIYLY